MSVCHETVDTAEVAPSTSTTATAEQPQVRPSDGSAQRRLFMVRRAERMLGSYQREGWLEDQPSRATGRFEIRPASEQGPIIVCLDTSGSMTGPRETVAKVRLPCFAQILWAMQRDHGPKVVVTGLCRAWTGIPFTSGEMQGRCTPRPASSWASEAPAGMKG